MTLHFSVLPPIPSLRSDPAKHRPSPQKTKQPLSRSPTGLSQVVDSLLYLRDGLTHAERDEKRLQDERRQILYAHLQNAECYEQWQEAALQLDALEGHDEWKADVESGDYNPTLLESRLRDLDRARGANDVHAMMHLVRTALSRDLGGMGNIDLYRHSFCGTKKLIERYVDSTLQTISALVDTGVRTRSGAANDFDEKDLLESMLYARQSFGRSALLLSGGGTFGMSHIGVLKALFEVKLLPRIISGASAGSIVCAVTCSRTDDEMPQLLDEFPYGDLAVFEESGNEDRLVDHLRRLLTEGNWSDIRHLTRVMRNLLGDITFQEAYNRTRRICNICVSTASIYEMPRLLNYVTAPNVMLWSAVAASCSVPLVFSAAPLLVKNPITGEHSPWNPTPQMWIDGSVDNDLPMTRLAEMFNVNHFIVSQVNPHVAPFLAKDDGPYPSSTVRHQTVHKEESDWLQTFTALAKSEALHRMHFMAEIGIFPNIVSKLRSILSQKYSGDINILPAVGVLDLPKILANPSTEFMLRSCLLGERATWPKLSRIRDRCAIELALDRAVHALRARVVFSKSQVDLRRMATGTLVTKRSHEPLASNHSQTAAAVAKEKIKHRQRRSSVSTLVYAQRHGLIHDAQPYRMTDDDTDEEERLEMTLRHPRSGKTNKVKLKKPAKGHLLHCGPKSSPALSSTTDAESFDFSRPLGRSETSPPAKSMLGSSLAAVLAAEADENTDLAATESASMTSPLQGGYTAELESSDLLSSDADVESHTEDDPTDPVFVISRPKDGQMSAAKVVDSTSNSGSKTPTPMEDMFSLARRESNEGAGRIERLDPGVELWH
ncbi:acyl transferase/acyl hydrolase/lysophospholipase [Xylariomycetidae sp. FL0641]|nr:acyl transferase/acyl hydrolase/lysophospholipase [Xylariomycetidae sp. FL0641]